MKLYLLRHAKTNQDSPTGRDFDRALLPKGIAQCALMREHLAGIKNIHVLCSGAKRTRQTLDQIRLLEPEIEFNDELYLCGKDVILQSIWNCPSKKDLMIVGHNYGISDAAEYLLEDYIEMRTCELLVFEFDISSWEEVSRGLGTLVDRYRPLSNGY